MDPASVVSRYPKRWLVNEVVSSILCSPTISYFVGGIILRSAADTELALSPTRLARQLHLAEVRGGLLNLAGVAHHRPVDVLHTRHAELGARFSTERVNAKRRGNLDPAAGNTANKSLIGW